MKRYRFEAALQRSHGWGAFVIFPHSTEQEFGIKGRVPVQALFGGIPYTGSLMPSGAGYHFLGVTKAIREQLGKAAGDLIRVELWKDELPRSVELPEGFVNLLKKEKLSAAFEALSFTRRKEYRNYINSAKREDTRMRRTNKAIELLRAEMTASKAKGRSR
jgi:D-alanine-D-alanine ligase-like ATP-grasp enzyme